MFLQNHQSQQEPRKKKVQLVTRSLTTQEYKANEQSQSPGKAKQQQYEQVQQPTGKQSFIATWISKAWYGASREQPSVAVSSTNLSRELALTNRTELIRRDWEEQLKVNPYLTKAKLPKRLLRQPIPSVLRSLVYITMSPNHQAITHKTYNISLRRARNVIEHRAKPFLTEVTLFSIGEDLGHCLSANFLQANPQIVQELESILQAFATFRFEIGQKRSVARLAVFLHSYLNRCVFQVFIHLCQIACSVPFYAFTLQREEQMASFLYRLQCELESSSTLMFVMFTRKYPKQFKDIVDKWARTLFLALFFDVECLYMDCIYNLQSIVHRKDFIIDRIYNYLFVRRFEEDAIQHVFVCAFLSLQRQLIRQQSPQGIATVLSRPRKFLDPQVFDRYLY